MRLIPKLIVFILSVAPAILWAQCPIETADTLLYIDFEAGLPAGWEALPTSDGGEWQINDGRIGFFENPGSGNWLYVNDEAENNIGEAFFFSPKLATSSFSGTLQLSFLLNFQQFADSGSLTLLINIGSGWEVVHLLEEDFTGRIQVDLSAYAGQDIQLGWEYQDGNSWNWGMGIDDLLLIGKPTYCQNDLCGYGESPEACPEDCPSIPEHPPLWVPNGQNLAGQSVGYRNFLGGSKCDDCAEKVQLGFSVDAWGQEWESVWINSNGNISFEEEYVVFTPEGFCLEGPNLIAPFFADADLRGGGSISYYQDPDRHYLIVRWDEMQYYGCEDSECEQTNSFQLILTDGSISHIGDQALSPSTNVIFNFGEMNWTTGNSSEGNLGFGGSPATVGINAGDGIRCYDYGTFDRPGYAYYGNQQDLQCPPNGVQHLHGKSLQFQTETGRLTPELVFTFIQGIYQDEGHLVRWKVSPTAEVDWFVVERSSDSLTFEEIATISPQEAIGPDPEFLQYLDRTPLAGTSFYRIKGVSPLGEVHSSEVVAIVLPVLSSPVPTQRQLYALQAGPNPFEREIRFRFHPSPEGTASYMLTDMSGRAILSDELNLRQGDGWQELGVPDLPPGLYILRVTYQGQNYGKRLLRK